MLMAAERSVLLVVDVQERLAPAIHAIEDVVAKVRLLLEAAAKLGVPVLASEQYPQGLGPTLSSVACLLPDRAIFPKLSFSCAGEPVFCDRLAALGRDQVIVCGIETHVCVLQTAVDVMAGGRACFVAADAVGSRRVENRDLALTRLRDAGGDIVSSEMVVFEWLRRAGTPLFREVSRMVR